MDRPPGTTLHGRCLVLAMSFVLIGTGCQGAGSLRDQPPAAADEADPDDVPSGDTDGKKAKKGGAGDRALPDLPEGQRRVDRELDKPLFYERVERRHRRPDGEKDEPESWPNAQSPGPDMANFPNSAFTVPRGGFQMEFAPYTMSGPSDDTGSAYTTQFLLRYGVTDRLEFRIFGLGYTAVLSGKQKTTGFSPIAFDLKMNLWDESENHLLPAVGLEAYIQTIYGSPAFRSGTQPALSLLFDHTLPWDINFEWNVGFNGAQAQLLDGGDINGPINTVHNQPETNVLEFNLQWALQRRFFKKLDVFTHGYLNSAAIPNLGDGVTVGAGAIWLFSPRVTVFGSYNAGLTKDAPTTSVMLGGSWAF